MLDVSCPLPYEATGKRGGAGGSAAVDLHQGQPRRGGERAAEDVTPMSQDALQIARCGQSRLRAGGEPRPLPRARP